MYTKNKNSKFQKISAGVLKMYADRQDHSFIDPTHLPIAELFVPIPMADEKNYDSDHERNQSRSRTLSY